MEFGLLHAPDRPSDPEQIPSPRICVRLEILGLGASFALKNHLAGTIVLEKQAQAHAQVPYRTIAIGGHSSKASK